MTDPAMFPLNQTPDEVSSDSRVSGKMTNDTLGLQTTQVVPSSTAGINFGNGNQFSDAVINIGAVAGRDVITNNTSVIRYSVFPYVSSKPIQFHFTDPHISDELRKQPFQQEILDSICKVVLREHLLVIRVHPGTPSRWFLEELAEVMVNINPSLAKRECGLVLDMDEDSIPLKVALHLELSGGIHPTVFLIPDATPRDLAGDLSSLYVLARMNKHYVVVTTLLDRELWSIAAHEDQLWHEFEYGTDIFRSAFLTAFLCQRLSERQAMLPYAMQRKFVKTDIVHGETTVQDIAEQLKSPVNIDAWLQAIARIDKHIQSDELLALLNDFAFEDMRLMMRRWYLQVLSRPEQMLVLGLCLLEGLEEDHVFETLEQMVRDIWVSRPREYIVIDHADLIEFGAFFTFRADAAGKVRLESIASGQRNMLLEIAAKPHQQYLRQLILWMAEEIKSSAHRYTIKPSIIKAAMREGTQLSRTRQTSVLAKRLWHVLKPSMIEPGAQQKAQRDRLRSILSTNLHDLYRFEPRWTNLAFLLLLADYRDAVHVWLAQILARWSLTDSRSKIEEVLTKWRDNESIHHMIGQLSPVHTASNSDTPRSLIHGVIVLTVNYVWRYIQPRQDVWPLQALLVQAVRDPNVRIKRYLEKYLLPYLTKNSLSSASVLQMLIQEPIAQPTVVEYLRDTYSSRPHEVFELLDVWIGQSIHQGGLNKGDATLSPVEYLLLGVARTLSDILLIEQRTDIQVEIRQRLLTILPVVTNVSVRPAFLEMCLEAYRSDSQGLLILLRQIRNNERLMVESKVVAIFRQQYKAVPWEGNPWLSAHPRVDAGVDREILGTHVEQPFLTLLSDINQPDIWLRSFAFSVLFRFACEVYYLEADQRSKHDWYSMRHIYCVGYHDILVPSLLPVDHYGYIQQITSGLFPTIRVFHERSNIGLCVLFQRLYIEPRLFYQTIALCLQELLQK